MLLLKPGDKESLPDKRGSSRRSFVANAEILAAFENNDNIFSEIYNFMACPSNL